MERGWERVSDNEIREWTKGDPVKKSTIIGRIKSLKSLLGLSDESVAVTIAGSRKFSSASDFRKKAENEIKQQEELLKIFDKPTVGTIEKSVFK